MKVFWWEQYRQSTLLSEWRSLTFESLKQCHLLDFRPSLPINAHSNSILVHTKHSHCITGQKLIPQNVTIRSTVCNWLINSLSLNLSANDKSTAGWHRMQLPNTILCFVLIINSNISRLVEHLGHLGNLYSRCEFSKCARLLASLCFDKYDSKDNPFSPQVINNNISWFIPMFEFLKTWINYGIIQLLSTTFVAWLLSHQLEMFCSSSRNHWLKCSRLIFKLKLVALISLPQYFHRCDEWRVMLFLWFPSSNYSYFGPSSNQLLFDSAWSGQTQGMKSICLISWMWTRTFIGIGILS